MNTQRKAEVGERRGSLEILSYTWGHANFLECKLGAVIYLVLRLAVSKLARKKACGAEVKFAKNLEHSCGKAQAL